MKIVHLQFIPTLRTTARSRTNGTNGFPGWYQPPNLRYTNILNGIYTIYTLSIGGTAVLVCIYYCLLWTDNVLQWCAQSFERLCCNPLGQIWIQLVVFLCSTSVSNRVAWNNGKNATVGAKLVPISIYMNSRSNEMRLQSSSTNKVCGCMPPAIRLWLICLFTTT